MENKVQNNTKAPEKNSRKADVISESGRKLRRETLRALCVFVIIWIACIVVIFMTQRVAPIVSFPEWARQGLQEFVPGSENKGTWIAEEDVYIERGFLFHYPILDSSDSAADTPPIDIDNVQVITTGAKFERNGKKYGVTTVGADECIVKKGEKLFPVEASVGVPGIYKLYAYMLFCDTMKDREKFRGYSILAPIFLSGVVLFFMGFCLFALRSDLFYSKREMTLCVVCLFMHIVCIGIVLYKFEEYMGSPSFYLYALIPFGLGPALLANMLGRRVGVCSALLLSVLSPILAGGLFQFQMFIYAYGLSMISVWACYKIRGISDFAKLFLCFLWVLAITLLYKVQREASHAFTSLVDSMFWQRVFEKDFWIYILKFDFYNFLAYIGVIVILPRLFERIFGVSNTIRFCELNRKDHPLMKRLRDEAPGTYEHCMAVADVASKAAEAIHLNSQMTEACGYFHDIGKLKEPKNFAENLGDGEINPHNSITPLESCAILREHVEYGLELGQKAHLPKAILETIEQHHGNGVMAGFYAKACKLADEQGLPRPDKNGYTYYNRRPVRPEVALVSLVDCCEAAVRASVDYWKTQGTLSSELVRGKVEELVYSRIREHQLDGAKLTTANLCTIIDSMVESFCARHHIRPSYAKIEEPEKTQQPEAEAADKKDNAPSQDVAPAENNAPQNSSADANAAVATAENPSAEEAKPAEETASDNSNSEAQNNTEKP